jgi:hypothetical protein
MTSKLGEEAAGWFACVLRPGQKHQITVSLPLTASQSTSQHHTAPPDTTQHHTAPQQHYITSHTIVNATGAQETPAVPHQRIVGLGYPSRSNLQVRLQTCHCRSFLFFFTFAVRSWTPYFQISLLLFFHICALSPFSHLHLTPAHHQARRR